jgi:uncharacterized membrane protein YedE/YeeE
MTASVSNEQPTHYLRRMQPRVVTFAMLCLIFGTAHLVNYYGWRHGLLLIVGALLGLVLSHAGFGFTYAFRVFASAGDGHGLRAQMLMLAVATLLFAPILALNTTTGGAVAPASLSVLIGAIIFSMGMQLGGGCGRCPP